MKIKIRAFQEDTQKDTRDFEGKVGKQSRLGKQGPCNAPTRVTGSTKILLIELTLYTVRFPKRRRYCSKKYATVCIAVVL